MSERRERIDNLVESFGAEIKALRKEAMEEVAQAEREASARERRYHEAQEELGKVEAQIATMQAERETLPTRAYRAGMNEDPELESKLKERFRNLGRALGDQQKRKESLEQEIAEFLPRPHGHASDARIRSMTAVTGAAYGPRQDFEHLLRGLAEALVPEAGEEVAQARLNTALAAVRDAALSPRGKLARLLDAVEPAIYQHEQRLSEVAQLGEERSYDLSPVGQSYATRQ